LPAPAPTTRRSPRPSLLSLALRGLAAFCGRLSWRGAQRLGRGIGRLGWALSRRDRRRALDHLALAFPERSAAERRAIARGAFLHQGMNLTELLHLTRRGLGALRPRRENQGWEQIEAARAGGRAVVGVTAHCGNWELIAGAFTLSGLPLAAAARELEDPALQELLLAVRGAMGATTIARGGRAAGRQLLEVLRKGGALAILIDQDTRVEGVWVPFFGRPAYTPVGAARIALRQGVTVVPIFGERREDGTHLIRCLPALDLPADETAATALMTAAIEAQVRRRPEQWVWWHKRWRRQPPGG
jgi:KDO2-lipid IV(A) lauroyltransferase